MPNFTYEIKRDLLSKFPAEKRCVLAALSALLATSATLSKEGDVLFVSENERVAEFFLRCTESVGVRMELGNASRDHKREKDKLTFTCTGENARLFLRSVQPETGAFAYAEEGEAALWYLRGAYLGGGSCTLPRGGAKTGYHLEFVFSGLENAEGFSELLLGFELLGKLVKRGEKYVVYLKSREAISDFLSVAGAQTALKRLEEVSSAREENNRNNRVSNCYAGNADKSAIASASQTLALRVLEERGELNRLDETLRETAKSRMNNPTQSLQELAETLGVSKSCVNHRLRKLMQRYAELTDTQEEDGKV